MTHEYVIAVGGIVLGAAGAAQPPASAIAWAVDRVLAVGPDDAVRAISRGDSTFLDLRGAAVTPAPTDPAGAERLLRDAITGRAGGWPGGPDPRTALGGPGGGAHRPIDTVGLLAEAGLVESAEPLGPGSPADLAFWSADPGTVPPDAAASLRILAIVRGGAFTEGDEHTGPFSSAAGPTPPFPRLFEPLRIGSITLRNRIVSSGHDTVMAIDGLVTDRLIAYQAARAAGGVGLIVVQVAGVHESARYTSHVLMATDDECIPGYRRLAEVVHGHGSAIVGQIFHDGRELMESMDGTLPVALAPSAVPNERFHVMPRAMPIPLIEEIRAGYAAAARRLRAAGLDGVEVVASHGYLPAQFLNPRVNQRTDRYGGSPENRLRFLRETIAAIRAEIGREPVVGLRISVDEITPEGLTPADVLPALAALDADGLIDYVSVVAGTSATLAGSGHIVPPMTVPNAYTAPLAAQAKAVVRVPVIVAGRINQPQEAERVLELGQADACVMTRALITDPLLPRKAAEGRTDEIRACVGCNQACIGHFHAGYPISCIQYPESGRELEYGLLVRASRPREVMVVGGGPGGLKAATVAAERGHRVTLYDAARRVGGQVLLAERLPGRAEFGGVVTNLAGEAERAGVRIVTGTSVDIDLVRSMHPDVVIVATGAGPRRPPLELTGSPVVLDAWQVLQGVAVPEGRVVVADWRCDWIGLGLAELLAERGRKVTLGVDGYMPGQRIQQYVRDAMTAAVVRASVTVLPLVRLFGYDGSAVFFQHVLTADAVIVEDVAALVLAQGHDPVDGLLTALQAPGAFDGEVHGIGDCLAPRTVEEAVLEGLRVASIV